MKIKDWYNSSFLIRFPLLWSISVFVMIELTYLAIEQEVYVNRIIEFPVKSIFVYIVKLAVFILLAYAYKAYVRRRDAKN